MKKKWNYLRLLELGYVTSEILNEKSILEKEKLNGNNFLDWYHNLRIVLRAEQKFYHLEEALPEAPAANATTAVHNAYTRRCNEQQEVACLMLASMIPELQKNLANLAAFDMLRELKVITITCTAWGKPLPKCITCLNLQKEACPRRLQLSFYQPRQNPEKEQGETAGTWQGTREGKGLKHPLKLHILEVTHRALNLSDFSAKKSKTWLEKKKYYRFETEFFGTMNNMDAKCLFVSVEELIHLATRCYNGA
ncbi:hypothetical protein CTI12_AA272800 [Artemisia annua]|uniref:Zinc finger, CCHC-type n=1 Tax=Artemisia annua TaxID=35608 RepID=A0A2U1NFB9_ARTAN|nr:hypothetical protein CTI12_AA272800 [Artemisia annua]